MATGTIYIEPRYNSGERVAGGRLWIYVDQTKQQLVPLWCYADLSANAETGTGPIPNPVAIDNWGINTESIFYDRLIFPSAYYVIEDADGMIVREGFVYPMSWQDSGGGEPPVVNPWENALKGDPYWGYEIVTTSLGGLGNIGRPIYIPTPNLQGADSSGGLIVYFEPGLTSPDGVLSFQGDGGLWVARDQWINYSYLRAVLPTNVEPFTWLENWNSVRPGQNFWKNMNIDITPYMAVGMAGQTIIKFRSHIRILRTLTSGADTNSNASLIIRINTRNLDICDLPVQISTPNQFLRWQFETEGPMTMSQMLGRVSGNTVSIICGDFTAATANVPGTWAFPSSINSLNIENLIADSNPVNFLQFPTAPSNISFRTIESEAMGGPNANLLWANMPFMQINEVIMTSFWNVDVDPNRSDIIVPFHCINMPYTGNTTQQRFSCRFYSSAKRTTANSQLASSNASGQPQNNTFTNAMVLPVIVDCPNYPHEYTDVSQLNDYSPASAWAWDNTACPKDPACFGSMDYQNPSIYGYIADFTTDRNFTNQFYRQSRHWILSTLDHGKLDVDKLHSSFARVNYDNETTPSTPSSSGTQNVSLIGFRNAPNIWKQWSINPIMGNAVALTDQNNFAAQRIGGKCIYLDCPNVDIIGDGSTIVRGAKAKSITNCIVYLDTWETVAYLRAKGQAQQNTITYVPGIDIATPRQSQTMIFDFILNTKFKNCLIVLTRDSINMQEQIVTIDPAISNERYIFRDCDFDDCVFLHPFKSIDLKDCHVRNTLFCGDCAARTFSGAQAYNTPISKFHNIVNIHNDTIIEECLCAGIIANIYGSDNGGNISNIKCDLENRDINAADAGHSAYAFGWYDPNFNILQTAKTVSPFGFFTENSNVVNNVEIYSNKARWTRTSGMKKGLAWYAGEWSFVAPSLNQGTINSRDYIKRSFVKGNIKADGYFTVDYGWNQAQAPFSRFPVVANANSDNTALPNYPSTAGRLPSETGTGNQLYLPSSYTCYPVISDMLYWAQTKTGTNAMMLPRNFDIYYNNAPAIITAINNIEYNSNQYYIFIGCASGFDISALRLN